MRVRSPWLVGREREHEQVRAVADAARAGVGGVVLVVGEAGAGKSRLVQEVVGAAPRDHALVGRAAGTVGQTWLSPFSALLLGCLEDLDDARLRGLAPVLSHLAPLGDVTPVDTPTPPLLAHALGTAIGLLRPGAIAVLEDAHDLAPDGAAVLEHLVATAADRPLALLATTRPREGAAERLRATAEREGATVVDLPPLSADACRDLAAACLPGLADDEALRSLLADADGLPLLVEDLLADALSGGALVADGDGWRWARPPTSHVPARFAERVGVRLARLDAETGAVVRAAALLGPDHPPAVLARASGLGRDRFLHGVTAAIAAQLLAPDGAAFHHALTREAVLATTPAVERAEIAARALADDRLPTGPLRAELLALVGRVDEAARELAVVAEDEAASGSPRAGAARLARASELARDPSLAAEIGLRLVALLALGGDVEAAHERADVVRHLLPREQRARMELELARASVAAGQPGRAADQVAAARSLTAPGTAAAARTAAVEAFVVLAGHGDDRVERAEDLARTAIRDARAAGVADAEAEAWLVVGRCARLTDLRRAEDAFGRALATANRAGLLLPRLHALHELGTVAMFTEVDPGPLRLARAEASDAGALALVAGIDVNLAATHLMRGEYDDGAGVAGEAERMAGRLGLADVRPMASCWLGLAAGYRHRAREAEEHFAAAEAMAPGDPDVAAAADMLGRGMIALLDERRDDALEAVERSRRHGRPLMSDPSGGVAVLLAAVEGELTAAQVEAAARVAGSRWSELWLDPATAVVRGRDRPAEAAAVLEAALPTLARYPVFGLIALRLAAEAALVDGWGDPVRWLADVERRAAADGHRAMASRARTLLRRAGVRVARHRAVDARTPGPLRDAGVTAREYEVLLLLHDRPGNVALAEQLHLSVRTVEKHVASLRRKLALDTREDLTRESRRWRAEDGGGAPMTAPA